MADSEIPIAIGIDIGSTKIIIAVCDKSSAQIIESPDTWIHPKEEKATPFCVAFTDKERLLYNTATYQAHVNPENTIFGTDVKQLLGFQYETKKVDCVKSPVKIHRDENGCVKFSVEYKKQPLLLLPEQVIAMALTKLIENVQQKYGTKKIHAVVTVPCMFTSTQRCAVRNACAAAEVHVEAILNDSTASAITYHVEVNKSDEKTVLIFDMGASCLSVGIFKLRGNKIEALAHYGDLELGGKSFDNLLYNYFIEEFHEETSVDLDGELQTLSRLYEASEKIKKMLSKENEATLSIQNFNDEKPYELKITRNVFETICTPLFEKINCLVTKVTSDGGINFSEIEDFIVVGNGWRILKVERLLNELFNDKDLSKVLKQGSVAKGAAYLAGRKILKSNVAYRIQRLSINEVNVLPAYINLPDTDFLLLQKTELLPMTYKLSCVTKSPIIEFFLKTGDTVLFQKTYTSQINDLNVQLTATIDGLLKLVIFSNGSSEKKNEENVLNDQELNDTLINYISTKELKFKRDEEEYKKMCKILNDLETNCLTYKKIVQSKALKEVLDSQHLNLVINSCEETLTWLDDHKENPDIKKLEEKVKLLKCICEPIIEQGKLEVEIRSNKNTSEKLMKDEKYKEVIQINTQLIESHSKLKDVKVELLQIFHYYRGIAFYELKQYEEGVFDLYEIFLLSPTFDESLRVKALSYRAKCYFNLEDYESCVKDAKCVFKENPNHEINRHFDAAEVKIMEILVKNVIEASKTYFSKCRRVYGFKRLNDLIENNKLLTTDKRFFKLASLAYFTRAEFKYKLEKYDDAIKDCNKVTEGDKNNFEAYMLRGKCMLKMKNYETALANFESLREMNPDPDVLDCIIEVADQIFKEKMSKVDDNEMQKLYNHRGVAFLELQKYKEAEEDMNKVLSLTENLDRNIKIEAFNIRAECCFKMGDYSQCIQYANQVLKQKDSQTIRTMLTEAEMKFMEKLVTRIIEECSKSFSLSKYKSSWDFRQLDKLIENNKALTTDKKFANLAVLAYLKRAEFKFELNKFEDAMKDCNEVTERDKSNFKAYMIRGKSLLKIKDYETALVNFESLQKMNPNLDVLSCINEVKDLIFKNKMAKVDDKIKNGRNQEAINLLDEMYNWMPDIHGFKYCKMNTAYGKAYYQKQLYKEAFDHLDEALKIKEDWWEALELRFKIHIELKNWHQAIVDGEKLKKINSSREISYLLEKAKKEQQDKKRGTWNNLKPALNK